MNRSCKLLLIFVFIFAGMVLVFKKCEAIVRMKKFFIEIKSRILARDRQTGLEQRKQLFEFEKKKSVWLMIERELVYSGIRKHFRNLSGAAFLVINLLVVMASLVLGWGTGRLLWGVLASGIWCFFIFAVLRLGRARNLRRVSEDLPKFLDFLGSYSLSAGEIMSTLSQISIYLNSPLRDAIDECVAESRLSGDSGAALLALADRIEHPQFKQIIKNIEMTAAYSADFTKLVADSRRGLREYLAQSGERRGMLREAAINMGLLMVMAVAVLMMVNSLIGGSIGDVLFHTLIGHLAMAGMLAILGIFFIQALSINK